VGDLLFSWRPEVQQRHLEILASVSQNRIGTKKMLMLELAVNVIVVQVAPGANTLRSPDLAEYMDLHFPKKRGGF
jgi:hypothetical protein